MATEKKSKGGRKCWCKDTGYRGQAHPVHGRARRLKGVEALIADLDSLRDDENDDPLGQLLGRAITALRAADRTRRALEALVDAHDEKPSMLTSVEWDEARAALGAGRSTPDKMVVLTMETETKSWMAVGRTEAEARAALAAKWDREVIPRGGLSWAETPHGSSKDVFDFYGGWTQYVRPGRAYLDHEDERESS